jgi:membrane associated rhomboid family serine protease
MSINYERKHLIFSIFFPSALILAFWVVHLYSVILDVELFRFGIYPHKVRNLTGIFLSPFIHGDFGHLISNTFPFLILGTGIFYFYPKIAYKVILQIWIVSGTGVWLMARESYHIGASGLVYGFASFLVFGGIIHKNRTLSVVSLLVIFLYGSIVWGIFPGKESISWEAHLSGFIIGILSALWYARKKDEIQTVVVSENIGDEEFKQRNITLLEHKDFFYSYIEEK